MPHCFPENNTATIGSDTRRSWVKMAGIAESGGGPTPPPEEVTATLSTNEPTFIPNTTSSQIFITLSAAREVDTVFTIASTNENVSILTSPVTITAGNLEGDFFVSAAENLGVNPFTISATSDIEVLNTVQLEMIG